MAYVLKPEKEMEVMSLLESGASIREAMRISGVAKQTVHSIAKGRRNFGGRPRRTYPRPCTKCGETFSEDGFPWNNESLNIRASACRNCHRNASLLRYKPKPPASEPVDDGGCRYMKQSERLALWGEPIPDGLVLGSACLVPYCRHLEHMVLRRDKTAGQRDYKELRKRALALAEGEWFDLPDEPNNEKAVIKFRSGLMSGMRYEHFIFRSLPKGGIRVIRYGDYYDGHQAFQAAFPVLDVRQAAPVNGLRPGCFYLGFMRPPEVHGLDMRPVNKCTVKACIFPVNGNGKGLCHRHGHFYDYASSMSGRFDIAEIYAKDGQTHPNFYTGWIWEDKYNWQNVRFDLKGARDPGMKLSEGWWAKHVYEQEQQLPKAITHGIGGLHHGQGPSKSKIKRSQRARHKAHVANKIGNHPEKKPREKFEREAISDLPIWVPPAKTINDEYSGPMCYRELETVVDDDEYEREMAMAELSRIDGEFEEAFAE